MKVLNYIVYLIFRSAWMWTKILPMGPVFWLAGQAGKLAYYVVPGRRKIALKNLELAFGNSKTPEERDRICRESFIHLCYSGAEFFFMDRLSKDWKSHSTWEGAEMIDDCIKRRQAHFIFGGHLGGWMLIQLVAKRFDVSGRRSGVVIRPQRNPYIDRFIHRLVERADGVMINTRGTGKLIEQLILEGNLLGFYMDQQSRRKQGIPVEFFGMPAYSHVVPGYLAWKHRIPMLPFWIIRVKPGHMHMIFRSPLQFSYTGDKEKDIRAVTQLIVSEVERIIRENPEQWLWAHNRWSRTLADKDKGPAQKEKEPKPAEAENGAEAVKLMDSEIGEQKDEDAAESSGR